MAQFGRPVSVADNTGVWVDEIGGSTTIYDGIDETSPSDADYIESPLAPVTDVVTFGLTTSLEDPVSSTGHTVRWRIAKDAAGGATVNLTIELRQGYVSEGTPGTLIATCLSAGVVPDAFTSDSYTLSAGEANAITDYTSLFLRFSANQA